MVAHPTPCSLVKLINFSHLSSFLIISTLAFKLKFYVYVCQNWTSSAHIKSTAVRKYCIGMYTIEELKHCVTSKDLNKSVCQARLTTSQPLLPIETCTRSQTPVCHLMPDYSSCQTSAWLNYQDCTVLLYSKYDH
jgi:hypothetical protein